MAECNRKNKDKEAVWCGAGAIVIVIAICFQSVAAPIPGKRFGQMQASVIVPKCVGVALTGKECKTGDAVVEFVRPVKTVSFFADHDFHLSRVVLYSSEPGRLKGVFTFRDRYGRNVLRSFDIRYTWAGEDRYKVVRATTRQLDPFAPATEIYFVPSDKIDKKAIYQMDFLKLLRHARTHTDQVTPAVKNAPVKSYEILVFCMDLLASGAQVTLYSENQTGESRCVNGWHFAHLSSNFAVNGTEKKFFYIGHVPSESGFSSDSGTGQVLLDPTRKSHARKIQKRLATYGYYQMKIDGLFGQGSRNALRQFKQANGLGDNGRWDNATQKALFKQSVQSGKTYLAGVFSNHYLPPIPPGPGLMTQIPSRIQEMKQKYASKVFENIQ